MQQTVGLVGVGIMGQRMGRNLVKAGFPVTAFDVNPSARDIAKGLGATVAADLPALAQQVDVVLLSLPDPGVVLQVVDGPNGLLAHARAGTYLCDASTLDPATSRTVSAHAAVRGVRALDCPVSGGPTGAEAGTLTVMVGGDAADLEAIRPVLQAIGKNIVYCGGPGAGQAAKLVNQALVAVHTIGLFEALLVGRKAGLALDTLVSIIRTSSSASWLLENHHRFKALAGDFSPGFALDLMFKDLRLFVETAVDSQAPALLASAALQLYNAARVAGHGQQDQGVVARELERLAGVELGKLTPTP